MKKVFELNVDIFTSDYREKVLVEAEDEIQARMILRRNFHQFWTNHFSNYLFYEYNIGSVEQAGNNNDFYKDSIIFTERAISSVEQRESQRYGYDNNNQLSMFQ